MNLETIREKLAEFLEAREWQRFHNPKDLALATLIEAGELAEHFLWKNQADCTTYLVDEKKRAAVLDEVADVLIYVLNMINAIERISGENIDIIKVVLDKIGKNDEKYPAALYKGKARLKKQE
ncbi:MAG: nucleotide pyrophosphohydrolase [Promethearchaeota archaeon]